ncbi:MAG: alpha/beta hydrolase [Bacteroidetes bacterium]|nr:alpha/beta hydrolase [Bacteroidota bacterium]MCL1969298.1 alpha/beta hydrolase [Bacteroidota bacterium]
MKNINFLWLFLIAVLLHSCTTRYEIPLLKQNIYYTTQINQQPYIIYIDTLICNKKTSNFKLSTLNLRFSTLNSTAYLINNSEFTYPQQFQINYKRKNAKALLNGRFAGFSNNFTVYEPPTITEFPHRYLDTLFSAYIYRDVEYAQAEGYWEYNFHTEEDMAKILFDGVVASLKKKKLHLKMDIYVPQHAGKTERPLLMLIHGGAFYVGDKSELAIANTCKYFASLGYTTASINYRMGFQPTKWSIERTGYMAVQDAHAALRFLIANAEKYRIDPNNIFVGGSSAGGITTLNLAFMQNKNRPESTYKLLLSKDLGNIESVGKHQHISFQIKSVVNLWGAIENLNMLKNNNVSILSYHGADDPIVPYGYDFPMQKIAKKLAPVLFPKIYGSKPLHDELKKLGYREKLVTVNKDTHNLWETKGELNDTYDKIINDMKLFFYEDLVPNPVKIEHDTEQLQRYFISNSKDVDVITWQCDGGFIINHNEKEALVIWKTDVENRKLITSGVYKNGAAFKTQIEK